MMTTAAMTAMTAMTTSAPRDSWWRPLGAAIVLSLLVAACSSATDEAPTSSTIAPAPPGVTTTTTAAPAPPAAVEDAPDPATVLFEALAAYADGYEFTGTATVNDQEASVVSGRWIGGASQLLIRSGSGEVEYLITAEGQWARLPDGNWEPLEGTPPTDNPLAVLSAPDSLEIVSSDANTVRLRGVFAAETLGLTGVPIEVQLVVTNGTLVEASYTVDGDGAIGTSVTTFSKPSDTTPITVPAS